MKKIFTIAMMLMLSAVYADELRLLSYNIKHGKGMDGKLDVERIAKVIGDQTPDLVALQEVDKNCKRSKNIDIAAKLGEILKMEHRFGKTINLGKGEYGLAVLSKFPIKETKVHTLPKGGEPRIALEIVVDKKGELISFVTLHLDWTNKAIRTEQVKAVMKAVELRKHKVVLAGDFNAPRNSDTIKAMEDAGWNVLKKNDGNGIRTFHGEKKRAVSATSEREEIDFIAIKNFPKSKIKHGVVQELIASDHRPIYAHVKEEN